jgi:hypothetical protein
VFSSRINNAISRFDIFIRKVRYLNLLPDLDILIWPGIGGNGGPRYSFFRPGVESHQFPSRKKITKFARAGVRHSAIAGAALFTRITAYAIRSRDRYS